MSVRRSAEPPVVSCPCGAKIRLPRARANRAFRCPQCKRGLPLSVDARVLEVRPAGQDAGATCPICQTALTDFEDAVRCPACEQIHHAECWSEIGGCGTYGCREAPELKKDETQPTRSRAGWGDTKICPECGKTIKAMALRCRYCRTDFDTVDPLTARDLNRKERRTAQVRLLRKQSVVLFVLSLVGVLAPVILLVGAATLLPRHKTLVAAGPLYAVMGYAAMGVSLLWTILGLFLFVLS